MNFLTVCKTHEPINGGTKFQLYLAEELGRLGHTMDFCLSQSPPYRPSWVVSSNILLHQTRYVGPTLTLELAEQYDYIVVNWYQGYQLLPQEVLSSPNTKIILVVHDMPTAMIATQLTGVDLFMCVSSSVATPLTCYCTSDLYKKIAPEYVHCGVNRNYFVPKEEDKYTTSNEVVMGVVGRSSHSGRHEWYRGIDYAQSIIRGLSIPTIRGKEIISPTEKGFADQIKDCDVIVETPFLAGAPTIVLEAVACGVPVITTFQGTGGIVADNINGVIVPKTSPRASIEAVMDSFIGNMSVLRKRQEQLRDTQRQWAQWKDEAKDPSSWSETARKFLKNIAYYEQGELGNGSNT